MLPTIMPASQKLVRIWQQVVHYSLHQQQCATIASWWSSSYIFSDAAWDKLSFWSQIL